MGYWFAGEWVESDQISLSVSDPSFIFGATIVTKLRVYQGNLYDPKSHWSAHCDRLKETINQVRWAQPNWERIHQGALEVAKRYPVVRVTLLNDGKELILGFPLPTNLHHKQLKGVCGWLAQDKIHQRPMAGFKTGNYLGALQALREASHHGAQEAILIATDGQWLETATGNLWGYASGQWFTPPLADILPGVMRSYLISQLIGSGEIVQQIPWTTEVIKSFEAIAYSNSVVGVIPFTQILGTVPLNLTSNALGVQRLQQLSGWSPSV